MNQPENAAVGLFGCLRDAHIFNLTVDSAVMDGNAMTGAVAGYVYNSRLTAVSLTGRNTITGHSSERGNAERIGGVLGGGKNCLVDSCAARADIVLPDHASNGGILCGGLNGGAVINGYATGTLTAGGDCHGLGAVSGSGFGAEEFTNCTAENVRITVGDSARMVGGLTGYAGGYEDESSGAAVTAITHCTVSGVEISTGGDAESVGGLVGGGLRFGENDAPTAFTITDCSVSATVNGVEAAVTGTATE